MLKSRDKNIKFTLIIGFDIYLSWRILDAFLKNLIPQDFTIEIIGALIIFPIIFYLGALNPTIGALVKTFLVIVFDYASGKINLEELLHRLEMLIQQIVSVWHDSFKKSQNNTQTTEKQTQVTEKQIQPKNGENIGINPKLA